MPDTLSPIALIFVALTLGGALLAVLLRNVLHAIFGLAIALLGLAGLFLMLNSPFLAGMQVLIYVGGISVAMVFAVMFAFSLGQDTAMGTRRMLAILPAAGIFAALGYLLSRTAFTQPAQAADLSRQTMGTIGNALLKDYNLAFESLSVVLLLSIIGAIIIARREPRS